MIDFRIERGWSFDGYQMWILDYRGNQGFICKPFQLEFVPIEEGRLLPKPSFEISGSLALDLLPQIKKRLAGFHSPAWSNKEEYDASSKIEKAMQAHIDSLKLVVDRTVK